MAIKQMVLAEDGNNEGGEEKKADPDAKRKEALQHQIKQVQQLLKLAKETDPKSDNVFSLNTRLHNLQGQLDKLMHKQDKKADKEKKDGENEDKRGETSATKCELHDKEDCQSTLCPESPNYNALTQI